MNKKFSTLVAALLVTGGSFAMVSQYAGSALAESPLAMAAAANLRAADVASEAKAAVGEVEVTSLSEANWTIIGLGDNKFGLQTGSFYLCCNKEGEPILTKNLDEACVISLGEDGSLLIDGEELDVDLFLWTDNTTKLAALSADKNVYVAPEAYPDPIQFNKAENEAIAVDAEYADAALSAVASDWTEFTVVNINSGENTFNLKIGNFYLKASSENVTLTTELAEATAFKTFGDKLVLGPGQYVEVSATGIAVTSGSDVTYLYENGSKLTGSSGWSLNTNLQENDRVTIKSDAGNGIKFTDVQQATLKFERSESPLEWIVAEKNGGFTLSDGHGYLALDSERKVIVSNDANAALIFNLLEGYVMSAGKFLASDFKLADESDNALVAYKADGSIASTFSGLKVIGERIEQAVKMDGKVVAMTAITTANLVNGETYMIWGTDKNALGVVANGNSYALAVSADFNGQATQLRTAATITSINQVLWTVAKDNSTGTPLYSFTNVESGVKLAYTKNDAGKYVFAPAGEISKFSLEGEELTFTAGGVKYYVTISETANGTIVKANETRTALTFAAPAEAPAGGDSFNAAAAVTLLNKTYGMGSGFGLMFKDRELGTKGCKDMVLEANPFTDNAIITAVVGPAGVAVDKMFLKVAGSYTGNETDLEAQKKAFRASTFIAVDTVRYSDYVNDETGNNFFKYTTVKGSEMMSAGGTVYNGTSTNKADFERGGTYNGITRRIENAEFEVSQVAGAKVGDPVKLYVPTAYVPAKNNGKYYLIGHNNDAEKVKQEGLQINIKEFLKKNYVGAYKDSWDYIYVGLNNDVDYKSINGIVNLISRNYRTYGQVYATQEDGVGIEKTLAKYVALDKPEGQFLVTGGDYADNGTINPFVFTNRESGMVISWNGFKKTDKANIYAAGTDTIEIKVASTANQFDGYANYKKSVLDNTEYVLKVVSNAAGIKDIYVAEDHNKDHSLGLNADTLEAANFKLIKFEAKADMDAYKDYGDTVFVSQKPYSYVAVDKYGQEYYAQAKDRVVAFTYAIYNAANNEFLDINNDKGSTLQNYFYCNPELKYNGKNADAAQRFIIKEKSNGAVQLIPVAVHNSSFLPDPSTPKQPRQVEFYVAGYNEIYQHWYHAGGVANQKVYAGLSDNKLHVESPIYKIADNDLFTIQQIGAPLYRTLENEVYDKVRIYKEGTKNVALFAESADKALVSGQNWLGMEHKADADLTKTMFSFVLDTAYVDRAENYKPQYLLAIDSEVIPSVKYCDEHGINPDPDCGHTTQTIAYMKGSYLVNLADSAAAWDKNAHVNPYKYDGYNRLGFVKATHVKDQLIIERGAPTAADTLNLTKDVQAKFALKIVDQDSKSFVLETKGGWIKWLNGVPVVVDKLEQAEVLNIEATENAATANEAIAAEGVQVIGGKGAVTVQGAAGKVITVANILGQTIANQVAASDNVTIVAPAGIVVVAVEGDATKVVVK